MRGRGIFLCGGGAAVLIVAASAAATSETVTYNYDALGRLTASAVSGGPNSGTQTAICMDPAGNRTKYVTTVNGAAACVPPPSARPASSPPPSASSSPSPSR